ncbi:MAG: hypothetical protein AB7O67_15470 [Vicinamibacterales bacterium]
MHRHLFAALAAVSLTAALAVAAEPVSVEGELITIMCYTGHGEDGRGASHAECARKCANEGYPLAVLTDDGVIYKITGRLTADNNAALQDLLTKKVVATGEAGREGEGHTLDATAVVPARP